MIFTPLTCSPRYGRLSLAVAGGAFFNLAILFPEETSLVVRFPVLRWLGYLPASASGPIALPTLYDYSRPTAYVAAWRIEFIFLAISRGLFPGLDAGAPLSALTSPIVREQSRLLLLGRCLSFGPLAGWFAVTII